jgi:hypothetical protein
MAHFWGTFLYDAMYTPANEHALFLTMPSFEKQAIVCALSLANNSARLVKLFITS